MLACSSLLQAQPAEVVFDVRLQLPLIWVCRLCALPRCCTCEEALAVPPLLQLLAGELRLQAGLQASGGGLSQLVCLPLRLQRTAERRGEVCLGPRRLHLELLVEALLPRRSRICRVADACFTFRGDGGTSSGCARTLDDPRTAAT
eukprot:TRINITY_DN24970_c0_g1_i3.p4 TRINITY_DN24970_c0_g1~~TRINITY_DN24970_c0_g1_i3.p4  ORF type:complete len:146 (-),score=19.00 TRINITY_DN24970_c0_g1_i3:480-917(-)